MRCNCDMYDYYITEFDGKLPEDTFRQAIKYAQAFLRYITVGRSDRRLDSMEVKNCLCAVSDIWADVYLNAFDTSGEAGNRQIRSENTDGYNVTYVAEFADGTTNELAFKIKASEVAKMWLAGTGLLNRSVRCGHGH